MSTESVRRRLEAPLLSDRPLGKDAADLALALDVIEAAKGWISVTALGNPGSAYKARMQLVDAVLAFEAAS